MALEPLAVARPLSWVIVLAFLTAGLLQRRDRERARLVAVGAWVLFGAFWLILIPHFVFTIKSIVEGLGSILAVPLSLYAAYLLYNGRDSLFVLTRAVGVMGLLYLPFTYVPLVQSNPGQEFLIEVVVDHTELLLNAVGVHPDVVAGSTYQGYTIPEKELPYRNTFAFPGDPTPITYSIVLACTGIGSISMIAGGVLAVSAPLGRKLRALAVSVPVIYVLNLVRNAFIAVMFGQQRMQWFVGPVSTLFGLEDPRMVSYYFADRLLAQFGSVVAMVLIIWLVVRELPEITVIVEDLLFMVTGTEYDFADAFGVDQSETPASSAD